MVMLLIQELASFFEGCGWYSAGSLHGLAVMVVLNAGTHRYFDQISGRESATAQSIILHQGSKV